MLNSLLPEPYGVLYSYAPEFDEGQPESVPAAIKILDPGYKDIVIRYNTVSFTESENQDTATLHFDYTILKGKVPEESVADFEITLGNLLHDLILQTIAQDK